MNKLNSKSTLPLVSIVVASYDRPDYLPSALASIEAQSYSNLEIIVVDNASRSSDRIAEIVNRYPGARLVRNAANLGFTGAMNRGIESATGEFVYCTLDDVMLDRDCIKHFVDYASECPADGLFSGLLLDEDGQTIRCAGGDYSLTPVYRRAFFGSGEKNRGQFQNAFQVRYVPGGMIFGKRQLFCRFGFRKEFFMYSEDADLCARVTKSGGTITVLPQAKAFVCEAAHAFTHRGIAFHKIKNLFSLYLLHAQLRVLPEFYLRYGVLNLIRALKSDRAIVWPMIKAWAWFLVNAPAFIKERYTTSGSVAGAVFSRS
jgi:GT2 family glycosyltransferase